MNAPAEPAGAAEPTGNGSGPNGRQRAYQWDDPAIGAARRARDGISARGGMSARGAARVTEIRSAEIRGFGADGRVWVAGYAPGIFRLYTWHALPASTRRAVSSSGHSAATARAFRAMPGTPGQSVAKIIRRVSRGQLCRA